MSSGIPPLEIESLWVKARPDPQGLLPCVVQDVRTRRVLMVAWVSRSALERALETGQATFWSRSRRELWEKGATSGNSQKLVHVRLDCDGDTLMYLVEPNGPACHEGYTSCFSWRRVGNGWRREADEPDGVASGEGPPPELTSELLELGAADSLAPIDDPPPARALRPEKAIRVGAPIESKARALANALQLKQRDKARDTAIALVGEVVRALGGAGVTSDELRRLLGHTERAMPAVKIPKPWVPAEPTERAPLERDPDESG